jgi:hypothetical protein
MKAGRWLGGVAVVLGLILVVLMIARTWMFNSAVKSVLQPYGVTVTLHGGLAFSLLEKSLSLTDLSIAIPEQSMVVRMGSVHVALEAWPSGEHVQVELLKVGSANIGLAGDSIKFDTLSANTLTYNGDESAMAVSNVEIAGIVSEVYAATQLSSIALSTVRVNLNTLDTDLASLLIGAGTVEATPAGVGWKSIQLQDISVAAGLASVAELRAKDVSVSSLAHDDVLLEVPELLLVDIAKAGTALQIATVDVITPLIRVIRTQAGELIAPIAVGSAANVESEAHGEETEKTEPAGLPKINRLTIVNGKILVDDGLVNPVFKDIIQLTELEIQGINPNNVSVPWKLVLESGDAAGINLGGMVLLQNPGQYFTLLGEVHHWELPGLSGYTSDAIGYGIQTGQFNAELEFSVADNQLDGKAKVNLVRPKFVVLDKKRASVFNDRIKMSLPMALSMLEDADGDISIDLPVSGDLNSPDVNLSGLVEIFAAKALQAAATHYLKTAIFPQATLLSLAQILGGGVYNQFSAQPAVSYGAGIVELAEDSSLVLDNVIQLMVSKPGISLRVCSIAIEADGIDEAARLAIAEQRKVAVRRYLLAGEGIEPQRVLECLSRIETEGKRGRVELGF